MFGRGADGGAVGRPSGRRLASTAGGAVVALLLAAGVLPGGAGGRSAEAATPAIQVVAVGSSSTQKVADAVLSDATSSYNSVNGTTDASWNLDAPVPAGAPATSYPVPADPNCATSHTYTTAPVPPAGTATTPDGSGAGVAALVAAESGSWPSAGSGAGCVALARSVFGPRGAGTDGSATLVFDAFALDAATWASASIYAPPTLTPTQLQGIYNCTFTDWGQVGGIGGHAIQRYLPRAGSDLRTLFITQQLGGADPTTVSSASPPPGSTFACPAVISTQLDRGGAALQDDNGAQLDLAGYQLAILPYDTSAWILQANNHLNPSIDVRNGVKLGGISPTGSPASAASFLRWNPSGLWEPNYLNAANPTAPIADAQTPDYSAVYGAPSVVYPGVHYEWFVGDGANPDYTLGQALVGFTNASGGDRSPMCHGAEVGNLLSQGFTPLPAGSGGTANQASATCRQYREASSLWAWGYNLYGHLGDGTSTNRSTPERIDPTRTWASVSTGYYESAAITSDGQLFSWGANGSGQLGDGTTVNHAAPERIDASHDWATVSVHYLNAAAITADGQLYTWGDNSYGQLGDGTTVDESAPVLIDPSLTWRSVSVGEAAVTAITTDGQLYAWGYNGDGSLGDGTTTDQHTPERIDPTHTWASVSAGDLQTAAITTDGQLYTWGSNMFGQLGDGTVTDQHSPERIVPGLNWASVSAGSYDTAAITTDGQLWAWGYNSHGSLGDGTTSTRTTPVRVDPTHTWASVSAGDLDTAAITTDGRLYAWGYNGFGQLGDGTTTDQLSPERVGVQDDWRSVAVWNFAAFGIRSGS